MAPPDPLGAAAAGDVQLFFLPELLTGSVPALLAGVVAAAALDVDLVAALAIIAALWYGGEALLAWVAGWHLSLRSPLAWVLRDLLLPIVWVDAWLGSSFEWRGNRIRVEGNRSPAG